MTEKTQVIHRTETQPKHCVWLDQCKEIVTKLHFETVCMKQPEECAFFEMYQYGMTPKHWLETQILQAKVNK